MQNSTPPGTAASSTLEDKRYGQYMFPESEASTPDIMKPVERRKSFTHIGTYTKLAPFLVEHLLQAQLWLHCRQYITNSLFILINWNNAERHNSHYRHIWLRILQYKRIVFILYSWLKLGSNTPKRLKPKFHRFGIIRSQYFLCQIQLPRSLNTSTIIV